MRPLAIDLYCGLGGWTEGLQAEGYEVVGFDIERHVYGEHRYPAQLVIQDVLTLHGSQFKTAALIVASPPCQGYSYRAMPWKRAKALPPPDNALFEACFRIQQEAIQSAGHHIPLVVENVKGAQPWVGAARWNYGSYYLWGDVPALMPMTRHAIKVGGLNWARYGEPGYRAPGFNVVATQRLPEAIKNTGGSWFGIAHNTMSGKGNNADGRHGRGNDPRRDPMWARGFQATAADRLDHIKAPGGGRDGWFGAAHPSPMRKYNSKSSKRRMASAMIAKIPITLARHIGRSWKPVPLPQEILA